MTIFHQPRATPHFRFTKPGQVSECCGPLCSGVLTDLLGRVRSGAARREGGDHGLSDAVDDGVDHLLGCISTPAIKNKNAKSSISSIVMLERVDIIHRAYR